MGKINIEVDIPEEIKNKEKLKMKNVAINFAEWIVREFWILSSNDLWYQKSDGNTDKGLTTEEIYELFLEEANFTIKNK